MELSEKHQLLRKLFREFAETEFTPELLDSLEETGAFNREIHDKMGAQGMLGVKIPEQYGGAGGDNLAYVLLIEEFAKVSPVLSVYANTSNSLGAGPLLYCGTEAQKQAYLPDIASGKKIIVFGLTEPEAGSDAGGTRTTADMTPEGDFILNGRKTFISGAPFADNAVIYAKTDRTQKGSKGISMFIVDMNLPGVTRGKPERKMGITGYPTSDIILDNVRVPKECLLGPLHKGFSTAMKTLDGGRLGMAAQALGIAEGCMAEAIQYAKTRKQFGKPISAFQGVSFPLAALSAEIEAVRELIYSTAVKMEQGGNDISKLCAMCKYLAGELANKCAYQAVQTFGGYGYIKDYKVERFYRDARISTLYEGTSEIQLLVIANSILR